MKKRKHKKDDEYWEQLEKELGEEKFDEFLDKFESDFEKEFGNALYKQTATVQKRIPATKSPR